MEVDNSAPPVQPASLEQLAPLAQLVPRVLLDQQESLVKLDQLDQRERLATLVLLEPPEVLELQEEDKVVQPVALGGRERWVQPVPQE